MVFCGKKWCKKCKKTSPKDALLLLLIRASSKWKQEMVFTAAGCLSLHTQSQSLTFCCWCTSPSVHLASLCQRGLLTHGPLSFGMISASLTLQMHTHAHIEALSVTASLFTHWNTVYIYCFFTMRHFVWDKDLLPWPSASSPSPQACTVTLGSSPPGLCCKRSIMEHNNQTSFLSVPGCT